MSGSAVTSHDWLKKGKVLPARQTTSYFLSFQGYLSILEAVRLLHRYHKKSLRPEADQASGNRAASSSSSGSVFERSDEQVTRRLEQESLNIQNQNKKRDDKKNADDPLADLPFWLEDFHTVLRNQTWNILRKWYQHRGSTAFILTARQTEIATSAWEPK